MRLRIRSFSFSWLLLLLVVSVRSSSAQTDSARLLVERAAAKALRDERIAKTFKVERYQLALRSWNEAGGWRGDRSPGDAAAIAKDLKIPLSANDPAVVECERPRTSKPCGITGNTSLVTFGVPAFIGDSATIELSFWFWSPPDARALDRFPDRPGGYIVYLVVKEKATWRVARVLRRSIK